MIFQVPSVISKISTMSNGLRLSIDTQDVLSGDAMERLFKLYNKIGWFTFNVHQIEAEDIVDLPEIVTRDRKSKSQKLREVLYRFWESNSHGFDDFQGFYDFWMDSAIQRVKDKLE